MKTFYDKLTRVRVFYTVFSVTATVRLIGQDSAGDAADPFIGQLSLPSFKKSLKADALLLRKTCGHSSAERMGSREEGEGLSVNPLHSKRKEDNERKQKRMPLPRGPLPFPILFIPNTWVGKEPLAFPCNLVFCKRRADVRVSSVSSVTTEEKEC